MDPSWVTGLKETELEPETAGPDGAHSLALELWGELGVGVQASAGGCRHQARGWTFPCPDSVDALPVPDALLAPPAQEALAACWLLLSGREGPLAGSGLHHCLACPVPASLAPRQAWATARPGAGPASRWHPLSKPSLASAPLHGGTLQHASGSRLPPGGCLGVWGPWSQSWVLSLSRRHARHRSGSPRRASRPASRFSAPRASHTASGTFSSCREAASTRSR